MIEDLNKYLQIILAEMCSRVGADPLKIDFKKSDWYREYSWTKDDEKLFIEWLTDQLYDNKFMREKILEVPRKNKKHCRKAAEWFVFNYGWKYREE